MKGVVSRTVSDLAPDSAARCLVWDTGNRSWAGLGWAGWLAGIRASVVQRMRDLIVSSINWASD